MVDLFFFTATQFWTFWQQGTLLFLLLFDPKNPHEQACMDFCSVILASEVHRTISVGLDLRRSPVQPLTQSGISYLPGHIAGNKIVWFLCVGAYLVFAVENMSGRRKVTCQCYENCSVTLIKSNKCFPRVDVMEAKRINRRSDPPNNELILTDCGMVWVERDW